MEEVRTVHFVTKDPIQNLRVKVTVQRLSAARPKANIQQTVPLSAQTPMAVPAPPQQPQPIEPTHLAAAAAGPSGAMGVPPTAAAAAPAMAAPPEEGNGQAFFVDPFQATLEQHLQHPQQDSVQAQVDPVILPPPGQHLSTVQLEQPQQQVQSSGYDAQQGQRLGSVQQEQPQQPVQCSDYDGQQQVLGQLQVQQAQQQGPFAIGLQPQQMQQGLHEAQLQQQQQQGPFAIGLQPQQSQQGLHEAQLQQQQQLLLPQQQVGEAPLQQQQVQQQMLLQQQQLQRQQFEAHQQQQQPSMQNWLSRQFAPLSRRLGAQRAPVPSSGNPVVGQPVGEALEDFVQQGGLNQQQLPPGLPQYEQQQQQQQQLLQGMQQDPQYSQLQQQQYGQQQQQQQQQQLQHDQLPYETQQVVQWVPPQAQAPQHDVQQDDLPTWLAQQQLQDQQQQQQQQQQQVVQWLPQEGQSAQFEPQLGQQTGQGADVDRPEWVAQQPSLALSQEQQQGPSQLWAPQQQPQEQQGPSQQWAPQQQPQQQQGPSQLWAPQQQPQQQGGPWAPQLEQSAQSDPYASAGQQADVRQNGRQPDQLPWAPQQAPAAGRQQEQTPLYVVPPSQQQQQLPQAARVVPAGAGGDPPLDAGAVLESRFEVSRVFAWQEKVYSRSEVAKALLQARAEDATTQANRQTPDADAAARGERSKRTMAMGSDVAANIMAKQKKGRLDAGEQGSMLFSYVHGDEFCERQETDKALTTSSGEKAAPLFRKVMGDNKKKLEVLNFRSMYIMADVGDEHGMLHKDERVLVHIKAYPDGSFDMRPSFNREGKRYRFEDSHGGIYEYTIEDVSAKTAPSLIRRTAALQQHVVARAAEMKALALGSKFQKPPEDQASMRVLLLGELMAGADFNRDHLYVEFALRFDPAHWEMASSDWQPTEPGLYKGVTAISSVRLYPPDDSTATPHRFVAHWSHPIECELLSRGSPPPPSKAPSLYFQVCTLDLMNRYTCEGYGWMSLSGCMPASTGVHYVRTWRPAASLRDKQQEFFIGGSREIDDLAYLERGALGGGSGPSAPDPKQAAFLKAAAEMGSMQEGGATAGAHAHMRTNPLAVEEPGDVGVPPRGAGDAAAQGQKQVLNKYGFHTESSGTLKVRIQCISQQYNRDVASAVLAAAAAASASARSATFHHTHPRDLLGASLTHISASVTGPQGLAALPNAASIPRHRGGGVVTLPPIKQRRQQDTGLATVVTRARSRLRDARGGEIMLRPGAAAEAPRVRVHPPESLQIPEGSVLELRVEATGMEPMRYQWYKGDKRLNQATADSSILIIAEAGPADAGTYFCEVSNKDGHDHSSKCLVKLDKLSRKARAAGFAGGRHSRGPSYAGDGLSRDPSNPTVLRAGSHRRTTSVGSAGGSDAGEPGADGDGSRGLLRTYSTRAQRAAARARAQQVAAAGRTESGLAPQVPGLQHEQSGLSMQSSEATSVGLSPFEAATHSWQQQQQQQQQQQFPHAFVPQDPRFTWQQQQQQQQQQYLQRPQEFVSQDPGLNWQQQHQQQQQHQYPQQPQEFFPQDPGLNWQQQHQQQQQQQQYPQQPHEFVPQDPGLNWQQQQQQQQQQQHHQQQQPPSFAQGYAHEAPQPTWQQHPQSLQFPLQDPSQQLAAEQQQQQQQYHHQQQQQLAAELQYHQQQQQFQQPPAAEPLALALAIQPASGAASSFASQPASHFATQPAAGGSEVAACSLASTVPSPGSLVAGGREVGTSGVSGPSPLPPSSPQRQ